MSASSSESESLVTPGEVSESSQDPASAEGSVSSQRQASAEAQVEAPRPQKPRRTRKSRVSPNLHPEGSLRVRYRIRFSKTDLLRWISHRDLASLWERIGRRVGLPFSMTEGFHPKPRLMFPSALPLGVESLDEVVDLELDREWDESELLGKLREDQQPGLAIHHATRVDLTEGKARLAGRQYRVTLPDDFNGAERSQVELAIEQLKGSGTITIDRKGKDVVTHVPTQIPSLELQADCLIARLVNGEAASLKIHDILDLLSISDWPDRGTTLIRTHTFLRGEEMPSSDSTKHS
ncbi:TIGR03936 family radical SAM-associated protein [Neorhodopirellula lusitana]|uniref:TIGR03936 family radical SAM-associated protein n=1 Tax=Neorhodopirellula lusitana TaxID=445327 RepID=UPI00384CC014